MRTSAEIRVIPRGDAPQRVSWRYRGCQQRLLALRVCAIAGVLAGLALPALACDIPVYLWALQRWTPDSYQVFIFRQEPLSPSDQTTLERLKEKANAGAARANLSVHEVNLASSLDDRTRELWEAQSSPELPWMVLRHPVPAPVNVKTWAGPFTDASAMAVLDSPKRQEIAKQLLEGDGVVWVLLEIGDQLKDGAAAKTLDDTLRDVEKNPPRQGHTTDATTSGTVYRPPRFPVIRVSRGNAEERILVEMLLGVEPDLRDYAEPIAIPIFGRGRMLYALVGEGINGDTIRKACTFLVSGCSCEVKEQNPGMDMLMTADWEGRMGDLDAVEDTPLPPLPGVPQRKAAVDEATPGTSSSPILRNLLSALMAGVVLVAAVSLVLWKRRDSKPHA